MTLAGEHIRLNMFCRTYFFTQNPSFQRFLPPFFRECQPASQPSCTVLRSSYKSLTGLFTILICTAKIQDKYRLPWFYSRGCLPKGGGVNKNDAKSIRDKRFVPGVQKITVFFNKNHLNIHFTVKLNINLSWYVKIINILPVYSLSRLWRIYSTTVSISMRL